MAARSNLDVIAVRWQVLTPRGDDYMPVVSSTTPLQIPTDGLPVPLPSEDVQSVRDWLNRVLPLAACEAFLFTITKVEYDCGIGAPDWIRKLAKEVTSTRPTPKDVQLTCYIAMIQQPLGEVYERIFETRLSIEDDVRVDAPVRFQKYMNEYYRWRLESVAREHEAFRKDPKEGRAAVSRVCFEVICDPLLFPEDFSSQSDSQ
jgi:hypothetical protein